MKAKPMPKKGMPPKAPMPMKMMMMEKAKAKKGK